MQHILFLRDSCLLAKHGVSLGILILRCLVVESFVGAQDTIPYQKTSADRKSASLLMTSSED